MKTLDIPMIDKLDHLTTYPHDAENLTPADIGEYLYFLTEKLNEVIEAINVLEYARLSRKNQNKARATSED